MLKITVIDDDIESQKTIILVTCDSKNKSDLIGILSNSHANNVYEHRGLKLNLAKSLVEYDDRTSELTKTELKILYFLMLHKDRLTSREYLIDYLWENDLKVDDNTLSVHVTRIRKKLEEIGAANFIQAKRGQGYML